MEKWQDPKVIAIWITIIVVLIFTIILFVVKIMHAGYKRMTEANLREAQTQLEHQKMLMETSLQAQEKERGRIAADLHDSLIGKLTLIRMKSQIGAGLPEIENLLGESITEARRISHDLTPPLLEFSTAEELIEQVLHPWKEKFTLDFYSDVRVSGDLSPDIKIQLLRVVQELLTNIIKHAGATEIKVAFRHTEKNIILSVNDNGRGFDTGQLKKGLGLNSLEFRMQYLNAKYRVKSAPGKGTTTFMAAEI
ncbi:sensor histidine kinase [Flavobacterium sp. DGU11]|uniref:histidine kinase n=1 Tax=Flavobacterium arundinis TaxID=3139143 RepID=A0ABU9HZ37_9FLAO